MKGERILVVLGGEGDNKLKGCSINKKQPLKNNQTRCNARQGQQPNASRVLPVFQQQRAAANTRQARQSKTQMCSLLLWIGSLWQLSKILNSSSSAPKATQSGRRNAGLLSGSCITENSQMFRYRSDTYKQFFGLKKLKKIPFCKGGTPRSSSSCSIHTYFPSSSTSAGAVPALRASSNSFFLRKSSRLCLVAISHF